MTFLFLSLFSRQLRFCFFWCFWALSPQFFLGIRPSSQILAKLGLVVGVARRDILMSRDKNCRKTIFFVAITLTAGEIWKEEKTPSLMGEGQFGGHFRRQFGRGQLRVQNCLETVGRQFYQDVSQGPLSANSIDSRFLLAQAAPEVGDLAVPPVTCHSNHIMHPPSRPLVPCFSGNFPASVKLFPRRFLAALHPCIADPSRFSATLSSARAGRGGKGPPTLSALLGKLPCRPSPY